MREFCMCGQSGVVNRITRDVCVCVCLFCVWHGEEWYVLTAQRQCNEVCVGGRKYIGGKCSCMSKKVCVIHLTGRQRVKSDVDRDKLWNGR